MIVSSFVNAHLGENNLGNPPSFKSLANGKNKQFDLKFRLKEKFKTAIQILRHNSLNPGKRSSRLEIERSNTTVGVDVINIFVFVTDGQIS